MPRPAGRPTGAPAGLQLARTSRAVSPAFEEALAGAGESVPIWLVQISLSSPLAAQPAGAGRGRGNPGSGAHPPTERHGSGAPDHPPSRRRPRPVVHSLDITVPAGVVAGFVGPSGAGKTTTLRMLLGLVRPSAGGGRGDRESTPLN